MSGLVQGERVYILAAKRTAITPRAGAQKHLSLAELCHPLIQACCLAAEIDLDRIQGLVLGNALGAGGNPARLVALAAGLPQQAMTLSLDSQCCSGLDAIQLAASMIASGQRQLLLAGGAESFSQRPLRARLSPEGEAQFYLRPPFTPWPEQDPEMLDSAAELALQAEIRTEQQIAWALTSHQRAMASQAERHGYCCSALSDSGARDLKEGVARRTRVLAGLPPYALHAATVAQEADAAALLLLVSESFLRTLPPHLQRQAVRYLVGKQQGADPCSPPTALVPVVQQLLAEQQLTIAQCQVVELMEAFAVQLLHNAKALGLAAEQLNQWGGALAWGHPIAASGAILAVHAYGRLQQQPRPAKALAAIAAAGGLGSAILLERG